MRIAVLLIVSCVAAAVASAAPQQASRIVDRTVLCRVPGEGYPDPVRFLSVSAKPRLGMSPPSLGAHADGSGLALSIVADILTDALNPGVNTGHAILSRVSCGRTSLQIALSSKRLRGGKTTLGDRFTCDAPATILIRLRAAFRNPVTFGRSTKDAPHINIARGKILEGSLAVATKGKQPISLATVDKSGNASIWIAPSRCRSAD